MLLRRKTRKVLIIAGAILLAILVISFFTKRYEKKKIRRYEKALNHMPLADSMGSLKLIREYGYYTSRFPLDTFASVYRYRAANTLLNLNNTTEAINVLHQIQKDYPRSSQAAYALFLEGFIQENYVRDFGVADSLYNHFLVKYQEHVLYNDVENALYFLGQAIEQMLKDYEYQRSQDSIIYLDVNSPDSIIYHLD